MKNIIVKPEDLSDFFDSHLAEMADTTLLIAEDKDENTEIYLTCDDTYAFYPHIVIEIGGEVDDEETFYNNDDAVMFYEDSIETYLSGEEEGELDELDLMRINDVDSRFRSYLTELLECDPEDESLTDEDLNDLQDKVFRALFEDYGIEVKYPMVLMTQNNSTIVVQHPYSEQDYADEE